MGRAVHDFPAALDVQQYVLTGRDIHPPVVSTSWDEIDRAIRKADRGFGPGPFLVVEYNVAEGWSNEVTEEFIETGADEQTIYDALASRADEDHQAMKEAF